MDLGSYGFRHDPMRWAASADGLDAAWVRTLALTQPNPGDRAVIAEEIERIFARQRPDGHIGEETHAALMRLLDLGCPPARPEFQRALKAMHDKQVEEQGHLKDYGLHIACRAGWRDADELKGAMQRWVEEVERLNFWHACPWTGEVHLQGLWAGREYADVMPTIERGLTIMADHLTDGRHWPIYLDPFGWLECMGHIDHPLAKDIVVRMVPMILRAQSPDGSWGSGGHLGYGPGSHTFAVFRALHKWGLMEPLRNKPPLPSEWAVGRTVPAPKGDLRTMTWDGGRLWVYDRASGQAVAISAEEGETLRTVRLPANIGGIAWSNGSLLATRVTPEAVLFINPDTGEVEREIGAQVWGEFSAIAELDEGACIGNVYCGGVHFLSGDEISRHPRWLAGGFTVDMACVGGAVWHIDALNRLLILSDPNRAECLIEWAGAPFGEDTAGLAWDGDNLWALDARNRSISVIERVDEPDVGDGR
jgi:hypothetical protein